MILAVLIDGDGRPVCSEMWPGNTADVTALVPVIDRLRKRFAIGRVCIVVDRGMISTETIAALETGGLLYILGVRKRTDNLARHVALTMPRRSCRSSWRSVAGTSNTAPSPSSTLAECISRLNHRYD
jgi:transposase